jgi:uncharacterized protein (DUF433 family)/DNA-binding transcriptional MerR regulator
MRNGRRQHGLEDRGPLLDAFRFPRGRYKAERAAQLSGVPARTIYDWALNGVLTPDFRHATPKRWSYRDLVYLRLLVRLRELGMSRDAASARVAETRELLARGDVPATSLRIAKTGVYFPGENYDRLSGQETMYELLELTERFDLTTPLQGVSDRPLSGPDLAYPSEHTYISPWVMGGEPCVNHTRVPTATVMALVELRGLTIGDVLALYPSLTEAGAEDAVALERRLGGTTVGA